MGSGGRMFCTQLWLLAFLAFSSLALLALGSQVEVLSAPNLLRVGTTENIFVEVQDCEHHNNISVEIRVKNHPSKTKMLTSTTVTLTDAKKYQDFGQITLPLGDFSKDTRIKQYVHLEAQFPNRLLEKVVLVSFLSGYIFIQTDKTLYTPESIVNYRVFGLRPSMEPVVKDRLQTDASVDIEIVNPDGIIMEPKLRILKSGIYNGNYQIGDIVSFGTWKIVAKFHSNPQQSFTAEFEVKEYVLPSFEVKLTPTTPFFYVDSNELTVNIKATYLFGETVAGTAFVVFGVMAEGQKKSFPNSFQEVPIERGHGVVTLRRQQITSTFPNIIELVGRSIYVAVSVLTDNGGEMVHAELRGIHIVTSPYTINFKRTPRYFKPGMSFDVEIEVVHPDGTPAKGVPVVLTRDEKQILTKASGVARFSINSEPVDALDITAKTRAPDIPSERQASATMTALPHETQGGNYIHIGVTTAEVTLGEDLKVNFNLKKEDNTENDITYLILSRGQLVKYGRQRITHQILISIILPITKDMLPSFRIIAYYHTGSNAFVSDSVWVDVTDSCMGSLKLEPIVSGGTYEPRKLFGLRVTGDPGATVGLVAVDKAVYALNNKHRLTQKKVWDTVEKQDTGCTPGGGKNVMSVFYDAGLLFETSTGSGTSHRPDLRCPAPSRRKRSSSLRDVRTTLVSQYEDKVQRECCLDGMKDTPLSYTCERRLQYIVDGAACIEAFLNCCKEMESQQAERKLNNLILARSEEEDNDIENIEIVSRTKFPESWLWLNIILNSCPRDKPNCDTMSWENRQPLPDSITTWQLTGISLSRTHGICVSDPLEVIVQKRFFIVLKVPEHAVRGEQLEIKAILHNYSEEGGTAVVDLMETKDVCSVASKRRKYRQEVKIGSQSTRSVSFVIIPMKDGKFSIDVKAFVKGSSYLQDGIVRQIKVVPEGILIKSQKRVTLDPARKGVDNKQWKVLNNGIPEEDVVPNTEVNTQLSVTGTEQINALVDSVISGKSMGTLIRQPSGCGEQNMAGMTLPVIATIYLDTTSQWETVGFERREEALQHIRTGYQTQLAFRLNDGSFAVFVSREGSTWLTAYVAKVFAMASSLVAVDKSVICNAIKFLILKTQQPDGLFSEVGYVFSKEMRGDVLGTDSEASMTAFCLIAMQESRTLCNDVNSLPGSINKAVAFLERRLPSLTNPYAVAITSYALANENKLNLEILYKFASADSSHWPAPGGHTSTLEATAYALLALVKAKAFEKASPLVRWFNRKQKVGGGYGSTQATILVYQGVAEYWAKAEEPDYDLNVDITILGRSLIPKYKINKENHYSTRTSKFTGVNRDVNVTATGKGELTVTMVSLYYVLPKEKESDCQKFNLSVQLIPEDLDKDEKIYKLKIEVLFKGRNRDSDMTILDIGLLTGFVPNRADLKLLSEGRAATISKFEMNKFLSDRDSLIIYLKKVSYKQPEEITFRLHQQVKTKVIQPAAVSVYEYYEPESCMKFYRPERISGELLRLCIHDECTCAEESCSMQRKDKLRNDDRIEKACEITQTSKIDFVYKVRVENFTDGLSTDIFSMLIIQVIKEGSHDVGPQGKLRRFLSHPHCREAIDLTTGKTYLIMGSSEYIYKHKKTESVQYLLGETTWIEYWPTEAECQTDEHRPTCMGMEELISVYTLFGCDQ